MMAKQTDFSVHLFRSGEDDSRLDELRALLEERGWLTASQISAATGWNDRVIRQLAEASRGEIMSGQKGYRLTREASADERDHSAAWLESQARKMLVRAHRIRRVHHTHHYSRIA